MSPLLLRTMLNKPAASSGSLTASRLEIAKDYLGVTGSFLSLILKRVPDVIDTNPVKIFFSLAKLVVELKEVRDSSISSPHFTKC